jgi:putative nucleotidyltransferase with HDIG domain
MPTLIKQPITQLQVGQYVAGISQQLGKIKVSSPGWISTKSVINELAAKGVIEVILDTEKQLTKSSIPTNLSVKSEFHDVPFEDELPRAKIAISKLLVQLKKAFLLVRHKDIFDVSSLHLATMSFIASSYRNPSAVLCLVRAMSFDDYQLGHAMRTAAYYCKMFRIKHWPSDTIQDWILGALLHDIGKLHMQQSIQQPNSLDIDQSIRDNNTFIVQAHVENGVNIANKIGGLARETIEVIQMHHERIDGSGYPIGDQLTEINEPMRIFTIIDELDRLMHIPVNGRFLTAIQAYQALLKMEKQFDIAILQQLIKSIGIYPPGSIVILKSGRVGIVLEHHGSTVKPDIKLIYDDKSSVHTKVIVLCLSKSKETDEISDFYHKITFPDLVEHYL